MKIHYIVGWLAVPLEEWRQLTYTPSTVSPQAVHCSNGGSEKPAEGAGKAHTAEEKRVASLGFTSFVPHADNVEA